MAEKIGRKERCIPCGWTGTEREKKHSGLSSMKGAGFCPECESQEFEEVVDALELALEEGRKIADSVFDHLAMMRTEAAEIPVRLDGKEYVITFSCVQAVPDIGKHTRVAEEIFALFPNGVFIGCPGELRELEASDIAAILQREYGDIHHAPDPAIEKAREALRHSSQSLKNVLQAFGDEEGESAQMVLADCRDGIAQERQALALLGEVEL